MTRPFAPVDADGYYILSSGSRSHFHVTECTCRCGCGNHNMDQKTIDMMEAIRNHFDEPMHVNSAVRCRYWNNKVEGKGLSQHLPRTPEGTVVDGRGGLSGGSRACDFTFKMKSPAVVYNTLNSLGTEIGVRGLGKYNGFTHADTRTGKVARW